MALENEDIEKIAKLVAEKLGKSMKLDQKPEPKCEFKWQDNSLVLECETEGDRDKAKDILNKGEVIIKVKPKDEGQKKTK